MNVSGARLDVVFQETGIWLWFVHASMAAIFAGLLGVMWQRLRRPLIGWLSAFFVAHVGAGLAVAIYWRGGLASFWGSLALGIVTGGSIVAVVPVMAGAARELRGRPALPSRQLVAWMAAGVCYAGIASLIILSSPDRPDLLVGTSFRPLALIAAFAPLFFLGRVASVPAINRQAAEILRVAFLVASVLSVTEAVFRVRVPSAPNPSFAITFVVVANLTGLLTLGLGALLATVAQGRAELLAALDREVELSRQEAQAARLESLGRLAAGIAHDFNGVFGEASAHLLVARDTWRADPQRALDELLGARAAVERGTQITTSLLRLARQQDNTPRRFSPVARLTDLLPVLSRMVNLEQGLRTAVSAEYDLYFAPSQFDQLTLNVLLAAMENAPAGRVMEITLHDVPAASLPTLPVDAARSRHWVQLSVSCQTDAASSSADDAPLSRSGAWRVANRELATRLGHAAMQTAVETVGGHLRLRDGNSSCAVIEMWLPALPPVSSPLSLSSTAGPSLPLTQRADALYAT